MYTSQIKMKILKNIGILCCCLMMASSCNSGGNKENTQVKKSADGLTDTPTVDMEEVKKDMDLSDIRLKFISECLNPFLNDKKVTTNCSDCDKFSFSYTLTTNEKGEVIKVHRESEIVQCKQLTNDGLAALHDVIESYFKKQILPKSFGKGSYTGQSGSILRC
jgi:hypothetical protein